jgi:hypothetical protein
VSCARLLTLRTATCGLSALSSAGNALGLLIFVNAFELIQLHKP